jgi:hypothetical protein
MNKIKMFWIIVLIILGLGNFYFFNYNQPVNEGFIQKIKNQLARGTRQKIENIQIKKDSFINQVQNEAIKQFL